VDTAGAVDFLQTALQFNKHLSAWIIQPIHIVTIFMPGQNDPNLPRAAQKFALEPDRGKQYFGRFGT
jgi:hypothetical protein